MQIPENRTILERTITAMHLFKLLKRGILPAFFLLFVTSGFSQAYCLLRDPDREIDAMFPEADSKKSAVGKIDRAVYDKVTERLGSFTLYFSELGRHTMYVPQKGGKALGLVHSRAVESKYGLLEVVWAFDTDLKVKDFSIQRCRSRSSRKLVTDDFRAQFKGKGFDDLKTMISADAKSLAGGIKAPAGTEALVVALIKNCLKTIAVSEEAWAEDLAKIRSETL